ncbi:MAG: glutamate decarboxylase [Deltaproteobacteria bacterium HGW-Deltaproteobacteria-21]|nr:MAG: glutamate decarboxylase [Deltaproteobacteria bacterium HGW-Deltaproteobacteria-21]
MNPEKKEIISSFEYLRKLFIMPDSPDKFIEFGHQMLETIHDFFKEKGGIHSSITLPELSRIFDETAVPDAPNLIKDVLAEIKLKVAAHSVKVGSPYYVGHMTSAVPYFMIILEMIIAALNQNQVKIETAKASSFVERELVAWFHRLVYNRSESYYQKNMQNPRVALGNVTSGGTLSNLNALLVAREKAFPPSGSFPGVREAGMEKALRHYGYDRGVILVSTRGHYSIRKAASILGLGEQNVITIPADSKHRMDVRGLCRKVDGLQSGKGKNKTKIIAIVGIAGNTETGSVDNLPKLAEVSESVGTHFHVDAAWGGAALLVDECRTLFQGIDRADSVCIDAHKLLYCPMAMGMILFKNEKDLNLIKQSSQYVIRRNSVDTGRFTIEGSRPFDSLKPWAALKIIGREGYGLLFRRAKDNTDTFQEILQRRQNFEILNSPELFILIYRFVPQQVKNQLYKWQASKRLSEPEKREVRKKIGKVNHIINALNIKLHKALRLDDTTFVSRTTLESTRYRPQHITVLRSCLINPLTDRTILEEIVKTQNRLGMELWPEFEPAYLKALNGVRKNFAGGRGEQEQGRWAL